MQFVRRQQVKYKNILQKEVDETIFTHHQVMFVACLTCHQGSDTC